MKQILFFVVIIAFLSGCDDSDNDNAKYIKSIEQKNNYLERDVNKKNKLKDIDTTKHVVPHQLQSDSLATTAPK